MTSKYHIVAIDNDYGHISSVTLCSSHETEEEAIEALEIINSACRQSYIDKADREKENYQRYLKWASQATVECPNQYGGFNWIKHPGDPHHLDHIQNIPYHTVSQYDGKTVVLNNLVQIRNDEPLVLLEELVIPPEHCLEYYPVAPKMSDNVSR